MSSPLTFPPFDFPLSRPAALLVIDMQSVCVSRGVGLAKSMDSLEPGYSRHLVERVETVLVPAIQRLVEAFRAARQPIFYTAFVSRTDDGKEVQSATIRYRSEQRQARTGASVMLAPDDPALGIIAALSPASGEAVLKKTSMDAFLTTDLDARLRAADGFTVTTVVQEVIRKPIVDVVPLEERVARAERDLAAGAKRVHLVFQAIARGEVSSDMVGPIKARQAERLVEAIGADRLVWEAQTLEDQIAFLRLFGNTVNLGHVNPRTAVQLEAQRRGLGYESFWSEVWQRPHWA